MRQRSDAGLTSKPGKCQFGMTKSTYLGHVVGGRCVILEESKVQVVKDLLQPTTERQVCAFLGLTGYYWCFIPNYTSLATPLTDLTCKTAPNQVHWTEECEKSYVRLKELYTVHLTSSEEPRHCEGVYFADRRLWPWYRETAKIVKSQIANWIWVLCVQ